MDIHDNEDEGVRSRAQCFSSSLSAVGCQEKLWDIMKCSLNVLIYCLQNNNESKNSKTIQRNSIIPESL